MAGLSALAAPADVLLAQSPPSAEQLARRGKIGETAKAFEASFLAIMLQQMFAGVNVSEPFGGGDGEEMFKSFMAEALAKQMTRSGGVGLASTVQREMLKLQGLES